MVLFRNGEVELVAGLAEPQVVAGCPQQNSIDVFKRYFMLKTPFE